MKNQIIWSAHRYDAFEAKANEVGGVGTGSFYTQDRKCNCAYGIAKDAGVLGDIPMEYPLNIFPDGERSLWDYTDHKALGFQYYNSDNAVDAVWREFPDIRDGRNRRVPFKLWARQMGIVRGD